MGFEELWDGFEKVCEKTERGEEFTRTLLKYFEKRLEIEQKYAKQLHNMNAMFAVEREMATTKDCWFGLRDETESLFKDRDIFGIELAKLIEEIKLQLVNDKKSKIELITKGKKLVKDLGNSEEVHKQARIKYVGARKQQQKSDEAYKKVKATQGKTDKAEKQLKKDKEKANTADEEYRKTVIALAKHQDKFHLEDMPALLKEFEGFEKTRIINTKKFMDSFVNIQSVLGPATSQSTDRLRKKVESMDPKTDLDLYVQNNRPESDQPPPRAQYMSWDGTLIEDVGPERKKLMKGPATVTISNQPADNKSNVNSTTSTPRVDATPVYTPATNNTNTNTTNNTPVIQATVQENAAPEHNAAPAAVNTVPIKQLVALYNYDATEENELTFVEGDIIDLLEENESGWWRGRLQNNGKDGLFPSNFVEEQGKPSAGSGTIEIRTDYVALYDYDAEDNTEISIKENDLLFVESETDGWYYGYNKNTPNIKGNFPSNFVEKKT